MRARPLALAATGLALTAVLAGCGSSASSVPDMSMGESSMTAGPTSTVGSAADVAFAQLMIPHHRQAIEMADLALANASSAEVKAIATRIKAAQGPEIDALTSWLTTWGAPAEMGTAADMDMGGMTMSGMMSDQDMADLEAANGTDFDRMWLQMMIVHHQGALQMASDVLATTHEAAVKMLARAIVAGQTTEVDTMKALLAS